MVRSFLMVFLGLAVVLTGCGKVESLCKSIFTSQVKNSQLPDFVGLGQVAQNGTAMQITLAADSLFEKKGHQLTKAGAEKVEAIAKALLKLPGDRIVVKGYTNNAKDEKANEELSGLQAEAVKKELEGKGVAASKLSTLAKGSQEPVAANDNDADRAKNRRVVLEINAP